MPITQISAIYFSATDTTKKVVEAFSNAIASRLSLPLHFIDITKPQSRESSLLFTKTDLVIIATPVYAGRVPNVLLPYLNSIKSDRALAVALVVFGNRSYDDALIELERIFQNNGFITIGAGAFVGKHSFSDILAKNRPDTQDVDVINQFAKKLCDKIDCSKEIKGLAVEKEKPLRPYYTPLDSNKNPVDLRAVRPKTKDSCTSCGLCASLCPMGAILPQHPKELRSFCIKCCSCVKHCPQKAKYFDDSNFLAHKKELEQNFKKRCEPCTFL